MTHNDGVQVAARVATDGENNDLMKDTQSRLTCNDLFDSAPEYSRGFHVYVETFTCFSSHAVIVSK